MENLMAPEEDYILNKIHSIDKINGMSKGQFPSDDENLKCYTTCIMKALRTVNTKWTN